MSIIAKTEIVGLDTVLLTHEGNRYVVSYGDYLREYDSIDQAFESYIRQVNKAYDDYR
jgi:hypothetical protein